MNGILKKLRKKIIIIEKFKWIGDIIMYYLIYIEMYILNKKKKV